MSLGTVARADPSCGCFAIALISEQPVLCPTLLRLRGAGPPGAAGVMVCCQHNATANGDTLPVRLILLRRSLSEFPLSSQSTKIIDFCCYEHRIT